MSPADFITALYGAVLGDTNAAGGAQAATSTYVTLEWPGLPLDPHLCGNIWASDNQTGSPEALETFAGLVDGSMPALSPLYQPAGISLEQVYALMLQASVPSGPIASAFAAAQATFAATLRGSLEDPAVQFHPSTPVPRTWCDPSGETGWTMVEIGGNGATAPPPPVLRPLLARPGLLMWHVAPGTNVVSTGGITHPTGHVTAMGVTERAETPAQAGASRVVSLAATRLALTALRPEMPESVVNHAPVVPAAALVRLRATPPMRVGLPPGSFPRPIPRPAPQPVPVPQPVTATRLTATFRYTRVLIQRSWLNTTLLHLPGWSIGGIPAGLISNGRADSNPGMLPLLPLAFIAVKDVTINGSWSDSDKKAASDALSGHATAAFGPFTLAGGGAASSFDGSSLKLPGIQIIAWSCQVMPRLPPL